MEQYNYYIEEGTPFLKRKLEKLKQFLLENGITYDEQIEYTLTIFHRDGQILGTGSRHGNVLKCIAISKTNQGLGYLDHIITGLVTNAHKHQITHLFLFTKPENTSLFQSYGFYSILETAEIQFMENTAFGISSYIDEELKSCSPLPYNLNIGAIVMNANPFTKGHLYLIEQSLKSCDALHVFVLSSKESEFPPDIRLELVKKGCHCLDHIWFHGSSDYLVSSATFPDYFMKDKKQAASANGELDLLIFCKYFRDAFGIQTRFVGEEPLCQTTNAYNQQMKSILPREGIKVIEFPRLQTEHTVISATQVRQEFLAGNLEAVKPLVPDTTYNWMISAEGMRLRGQLLGNPKI